jgi:hypothetical protein
LYFSRICLIGVSVNYELNLEVNNMTLLASRTVIRPSCFKLFLCVALLAAIWLPVAHAMPQPVGTVPSGLSEPLVEPAAQKCFRVNAESLHLRVRPFKQAQIVGYARRGDILVKRRLCSWRGWCPVRRGELSAWAWKAQMTQIDC